MLFMVYRITPSGLIISYLPAIIAVISWTSCHSSTLPAHTVFLGLQDGAAQILASPFLLSFSASATFYLSHPSPFGHVLDIVVIQKHFTSEIPNFKIPLSEQKLLPVQPVLDEIRPRQQLPLGGEIYFPSSN